jgi:uncharacterized damage-inducible protein DinB
MPDFESQFRQSLTTLLRELMNGPPVDTCFVLNPGDKGLIGTMNALSAEQASARPDGRSSIASHVDHVIFGFNLLTRWLKGENPWADADAGASWKRQQVTDEQWRVLREHLETEVRAWLDVMDKPQEWSEMTMLGATAAVVHLAYHVGAIRQLSKAAGPTVSA